MEQVNQKQKRLIDRLLEDPNGTIDGKRRPIVEKKVRMEFERAINDYNLLLIEAEEQEGDVFKNIGTSSFSLNQIIKSRVNKKAIEETIIVVNDLFKELFEEDLK